ncbi:MAG: metallophosphoesterase [Bryobacteraceae bacterium]|nr:metallophosphoesterase [Bryobacteraceae bacterium]
MKKYFVISDLHLNMGRSSGGLHPLEDFDCDDQLAAFLDLVSENNGDLILNGDWLDFLQLEPFVETGDYWSLEGVPLAYRVGVALKKLATCLDRHTRHFGDLAAFLKRGGRVVVMQGNHDADWFFPSEEESRDFPVQTALRKALGSPDAEALRFVDTSIRVGTVHIEHGHQQCEPLNAFQNHPGIFHVDRRRSLTREFRLELLWGSRFVIEFFNPLEEKYHFADNLKPQERALWLGIRNGWVGGKTAAGFLRFLWGVGMPLAAVAEVLEAAPTEPEALVERLRDEELKALFIDRMQNDREFRRELREALDAPVAEDENQFRNTARSEMGREVVVPQEVTTLGIVRDRRELRQARELLKEAGVTAVIFGHTHHEIDGNTSGAPVPGYFNTGTWTPSLDLADQRVRERLRRQDFPLVALGDRSLFTSRLAYAEVTVSGDGSSVELKYAPNP